MWMTAERDRHLERAELCEANARVAVTDSIRESWLQLASAWRLRAAKGSHDCGHDSPPPEQVIAGLFGNDNNHIIAPR